MNHKGLLVLGNNLRVVEGRVWGTGGTAGMERTGLCCNEHWESRTRTLETNNTLYVNQLNLKNVKKKKENEKRRVRKPLGIVKVGIGCQGSQPCAQQVGPSPNPHPVREQAWRLSIITNG